MLVFEQVNPARFEARLRLGRPSTSRRTIRRHRTPRKVFAVIRADHTGEFLLYVHDQPGQRPTRRPVRFEYFTSAHHAANVVASLSQNHLAQLRADVADHIAENFRNDEVPDIGARATTKLPAAAIARYAIRQGLI